MDVGQMFTENWPYKVAAIILSVLLWLSVSAGGERREQTVPTRLELQINDSTWSLREAPSQVMTTFRGSGGGLFAPLFEQPTIRKVIDHVTDPVMQIPLSPSDVIYDRSLGVEPTAVEPTSVIIHLEERFGKWVAVSGRTDARAAPGTMVVEIQVAPDSAWLQGPASFVNSITGVTTELLEVGTISQSVSRQLAVALPPDLTGLEITPSTVLGSVHVDSVRTRRFQRTVTAIGPFAAGVQIDPPTVTVEVTGAAATIDALDARDLRVIVELDASLDEGGSRRVRVDLPADVTATIGIEPERVLVTPASRSTSPDPSRP